VDGRKESNKTTAKHFEKLTISLHKGGCSEAGSNTDKACKQNGGSAAIDNSTAREPDIIFPEENVSDLGAFPRRVTSSVAMPSEATEASVPLSFHQPSAYD
jgi:hypothetical protein